MTFHSNCTPLPFIKFSLSDHIIIIFEPTLTCWALYFTIIFLSIYQIQQGLTKISSGLTSINIPSISLFLLHVRLSYFMTVFYFLFFWPYLMAVKEKAMAPHSSTLAWKIPWVEEPGGLQSMGSLRVGHDWTTSLSCIGEGNGNPLQCSFLENPGDGGAWWAAVYGVTQSRTRLKRLSSSMAVTPPNPSFCSRFHAQLDSVSGPERTPIQLAPSYPKEWTKCHLFRAL